VEKPGDFVEVNTLDLRPAPGVVLKQFTARDMISRWDVIEVHRRATSTAATLFLDTLQRRLPFPLRALQVDGGSEFAAAFEAACRQRGVRLLVLPPRSPNSMARWSPPTVLIRRSSMRSTPARSRSPNSIVSSKPGNLWRRLALPYRISNWSLTSLQQRLVKTGGRLIKHARYYWLLLAESHLTRRLFGSMLLRIAGLSLPAG